MRRPLPCTSRSPAAFSARCVGRASSQAAAHGWQAVGVFWYSCVGQGLVRQCAIADTCSMVSKNWSTNVLRWDTLPAAAHDLSMGKLLHLCAENRIISAGAVPDPFLSASSAATSLSFRATSPRTATSSLSSARHSSACSMSHRWVRLVVRYKRRCRKTTEPVPSCGLAASSANIDIRTPQLLRL
jgi:hypothetical protein